MWFLDSKKSLLPLQPSCHKRHTWMLERVKMPNWDMVALACNPGTQEAEAENGEFKASLNNILETILSFSL